mgnify:FL=1
MKHLLLTTIAAMLFVWCGLAGPIHDAIMNENIDEVQLQLAAGADVNEENSIGYTPLHYAAGVGRIDIVELLIEHGANINATDSSNKGATPLDYAHWKGQMEVVEVLKAHNAQRTYGEGGKGDNKGERSIKITNIGDGSVMLEFKSGVLQAANSINGPWEDVDEVSPVTWTADQFSKFARLKFSK